MPYTDVASVRLVLPEGVEINDTTTVPSMSTVTTWIAQISSQVNVAASVGGLALPITDADLLAALKILCSRETAYQVMLSRGASENPEHKPMWKSWHDDFMKMLELLQKGELVEVSSVESGEPWSTGMDSVDGDEFSAEITKTRIF